MPSAVLRQQRTASTPQEAAAAVAEWFGAADVTSKQGSFVYRHLSLADDGVTLTRISCAGTDVVWTLPPAPDLVAFVVRDGAVRLERDDDLAVLATDQIGLIPLGEAVTLRLQAASLDAFSMTSSAVATLLGVLGRPLRLHAPRLTPVSVTLANLWRDTAQLLATKVLTAPDAYQRDLLRSQMIGALTATTIEAFALSDRSDDGARDAAIQAKAEKFMRSRLREPISIPDIALAAGTSIRGLQLAYRRARQVSPLLRLRQLRMEAAHVALENGNGSTVSAVARSFGYANPGRFAAHYRSQYGEPPSATLSRGHASHRPETQ